MNNQGILTTNEEFSNAGLGDFIFPETKGEFIGTLINRAWHKKSPALICFFETEDYKKYKLLVWNTNGYQPKKSDISFSSDVADGTKWKCVFNNTKNGSINWLTAELVK